MRRIIHFDNLTLDAVNPALESTDFKVQVFYTPHGKTLKFYWKNEVWELSPESFDQLVELLLGRGMSKDIDFS